MAKAQIILNGASGRMGQEIQKILAEHTKAVLLTAIEGKGAKAWAGIKAHKGAVAVDFSSPEGAMIAAKACLKAGLPLVSGTTGLSSAQLRTLKQAGKKIPVLWSPNTSVGINLFLRMIAALGKNLAGYDMQIEEFHHAMKKDAPSGTAKLLQSAVEEAAEVRLPPVLSARGGGIVGTHKLSIMGPEETLTIEHVALKRSVFARGAIDAAIWLTGKKPGFYNMQDVLNV
jgi:4-hydroxy-tetrahydrodipicolinate reductase